MVSASAYQRGIQREHRDGLTVERFRHDAEPVVQHLFAGGLDVEVGGPRMREPLARVVPDEQVEVLGIVDDDGVGREVAVFVDPEIEQIAVLHEEHREECDEDEEEAYERAMTLDDRATRSRRHWCRGRHRGRRKWRSSGGVRGHT